MAFLIELSLQVLYGLFCSHCSAVFLSATATDCDSQLQLEIAGLDQNCQDPDQYEEVPNASACTALDLAISAALSFPMYVSAFNL